jgi:hypothetical protein
MSSYVVLMADGEDGLLQVQRVTVDIVKHLQTTEKGWLSSLGVGSGAYILLL